MNTSIALPPTLDFVFDADAFTAQYGAWPEADRADFDQALTYARIADDEGQDVHPGHLAAGVLNAVAAPASPWTVTGLANPNVIVTVGSEISVDSDGTPDGIYIAARIEAFTEEDGDAIDREAAAGRGIESALIVAATPAVRRFLIFLSDDSESLYGNNTNPLDAMLHVGRTIADIVNKELHSDLLFYRDASTASPRMKQLAAKFRGQHEGSHYGLPHHP